MNVQHSHTIVQLLGMFAHPVAVYIHAHPLPPEGDHVHREYEELERQLVKAEAGVVAHD